MELLKLAIVLLAVVIVLFVANVFRTGRTLAHAKGSARTLAQHQLSLAGIGVLAVPAVGIVEYFARMLPGALQGPLLAWHLLLVTAFLLLAATTCVWFNGKKRPNVHSRFAYPCILLFALVAVTGSVLLYQLP